MRTGDRQLIFQSLSRLFCFDINTSIKSRTIGVKGSGELYRKPVAILNASPRAIHAQASLKETLLTMDARIIDEASITVQLPSNQINEFGILSLSEISSVLHNTIVTFVSAIKSFQS
ncbi:MULTISPECIES: hypothetical protein [Nostocales]|uniref:Uncharacterized protein n=3 Tax=Nostocales TaxID=1161 RepID=A0A8S9SXE5_9CYAN|nr:hypothetical protein [Tolypothrix bouteillei]KAF3884755.1 hypothetical protein DA73_0400004245 [Tolypothrix bouteillei VB521301]